MNIFIIPKQQLLVKDLFHTMMHNFKNTNHSTVLSNAHARPIMVQKWMILNRPPTLVTNDHCIKLAFRDIGIDRCNQYVFSFYDNSFS